MPPEILNHFTLSDVLLSIIFTGILLFICWQIKLKNSDIPAYNFFLSGLLVKIIGTIAFCAVYVYYYKNGDALNYFSTSRTIGTLFFREPIAFFKIILFGDVTADTYSKFNNHSGWPEYLNDDSYTFFFVRLITPLNLIAFWNFISCSILLSALSYSGIWKLYTVFSEQFPSLTKELAIAVLYIPSVVFWGSGLLKDTITLSAIGWFIYAVYKILNYKISLKFFIYLFISAFLLLSIKPYILYALLIASSVWMATHYLKNISTTLEKFIYAPAFILFFAVLTIFLTIQIGKEQGRFSIKTTENEIQLNQGDNSGNSSFHKEPHSNTFSSIIKSMPSNINVSLFRPYFWEAKSVMTLFSALESFILLILLILLLFKSKFTILFQFLIKYPFLIFSVFFILILSFIVGLSTDNFGTLNRFRIPVLPFYVALFFILKDLAQDKKSVSAESALN